jgi:hypothetical protein
MKVTTVEAPLATNGGQDHVVIGEPGEDAFAILTEFAADRQIIAAQIVTRLARLRLDQRA